MRALENYTPITLFFIQDETSFRIMYENESLGTETQGQTDSRPVMELHTKCVALCKDDVNIL